MAGSSLEARITSEYKFDDQLEKDLLAALENVTKAFMSGKTLKSTKTTAKKVEAKKAPAKKEATKQITSAMELVATAKLKRARERYESVNQYSSLVYDRINELLASMDDDDSKYLNEKEGNTAFVVITSDMGLCGGYNTNALRMLKEESKSNDEFILIGNKAISNFAANNIKAFNQYGDIGG
jgi:F-type H+-transporting ATPase subunit gamma